MNKNNMDWEDNVLVVKTRSGKVYKFEEQIKSVFDSCVKSATFKKEVGRNKFEDSINDEQLSMSLIIKSCVEPKLDESFEFKKLPASEAIALQNAITKLYDVESFLE